MLTGPNTLLLDEPTNHMDIPAKEVLADAFKEFDGTILCISHDRFFIQQLATHIWEVYEGHLIQYAGDYDYYLYKRDELRAKTLADAASRNAREAKKLASVTMSTSGSAGVEPVGKAGNLSPLQARKEIEKRLSKQEKQIVTLEKSVNLLEGQLADPVIQQDFNRLHSLSQDLEAKKSELDQANGEWERLTEELLAYPVN